MTTAKRFTWLKKDVYAPQIVITDSLTEKDLTPTDCYELLNKFAEENEQLKTENQQLFDWINSKMIYYEELIEKTEGSNNVSAKGHLDMLIKLKNFIENPK